MAQPLATNPYEKFRYDLLGECPRAAYWLESMTFGIMAQTGMDEDTALELACKIVAHGENEKTRQEAPGRKKTKHAIAKHPQPASPRF